MLFTSKMFHLPAGYGECKAKQQQVDNDNELETKTNEQILSISSINSTDEEQSTKEKCGSSLFTKGYSTKGI